MEILTPHLSCIATPEELPAALAEGYTKIYMQTAKGIILHQQLMGNNRHIRVAVKNIPGRALPEVNQEINFLPAGKIPVSVFNQVLSFFYKVMEVKKAEVEAMAWIIWSEAEGYHVWIPDQTISKAAVNFDWGTVPAGKILVVDIHSHNTMGAFFSGTDDANDRNNISYSGVIGKMSKTGHETKFRFNYFGERWDVKFEDIFDAQPQSDVPQEWLDRVKTQNYQYANSRVLPFNGGSQGYNGGTANPRGRADHLRDYQFKGKGQYPTGPVNGNRAGPALQTGANAHWNNQGRTLSQEQFNAAAREQADIEADLREQYGEGFGLSDILGDGWQGSAILGGESLGKAVGSEKDSVVEPSEADLLLVAALDEEYGTTDPRYASLAAQIGSAQARLFLLISEATVLFQNDDSSIGSLIHEFFNQMTDVGKASSWRELFDELPLAIREKIEQNGL